MMNLTRIKDFSRFLKTLSTFFDEHGYFEVRTPVLSSEVIPESAIEVFETAFRHPYNLDQKLFLLPSPELYMKTLLAQGSGPIYQISPCFRNGEQSGPYHNPEFTMLEWYTPKADYLDSLKLCEELLDFCAKQLGLAEEQWKPPYLRLTMNQAFKQILNLDLSRLQDLESLKKAALDLELEISQDAGWEEVFNQIFLNFVEPKLPQEKPLFLTDYPDQIPCLAKHLVHQPCYQRWELYARGIELANCFTEEDDYHKLKTLFDQEQRLKNKALVPTLYPENFLKNLKKGFPPSSGVAMGLERLFMVLYNLKTIEEVLIFPYSPVG
ncbi:MAG: elongation factor P--(R)-beta-lysine ligase [Spirochaetales bacterium]|nr:elongation factor P--(R)-beta-lysine ligase [Spirochaetales bacterium]